VRLHATPTTSIDCYVCVPHARVARGSYRQCLNSVVNDREQRGVVLIVCNVFPETTAWSPTTSVGVANEIEMTGRMNGPDQSTLLS
jgi:hypothetical protein